MTQAISANQLKPIVLQLCQRGNYLDASVLVKGFIEKGYIDYEAADVCLKLAIEKDDVGRLFPLVELAVKHMPNNWRSWQLRYQAMQADSRWDEALVALDKVYRLSETINGEFFLAKAEAFERTFRPHEALDCLGSMSAEDYERLKSRALLLKANALSQQKDYSGIVDLLDNSLGGLRGDKYVAGAWKLLGRSYDQLGEYQKAFDAFQKGNQLRSLLLGLRLHENPVRRRVEVCRSLFTSKWVDSWKNVEDVDEPPVFLLGFPRSGTTLLEQVLEAHPRIQTMGEPPTVSDTLKKAINWMQAKAVMSGKSSSNPSWKSQWLSVFALMGELGDAELGKLRETYYEVVDRTLALEDGNVLVDKMPLNTVDIGFILRLFPNARFIVALRHPCDSVLSGYMHSFKMNDAMANFLDLENGSSFYAHVMQLLWQYEKLFNLSERIHYIRYEDLVTDFESEARKVIDFLGVEWSDEVLHYDERALRRNTISTPSYQGVTQKIYSSSKERWRNYAQLMAPVLPHFEEAAKRYGYDLTF